MWRKVWDAVGGWEGWEAKSLEIIVFDNWEVCWYSQLDLKCQREGKVSVWVEYSSFAIEFGQKIEL